jgi:hypothetical protein|tara:strand:+ start:131 stop:277 length:147 start_codon:yes stop_codon:yes gene_type:complete
MEASKYLILLLSNPNCNLKMEEGAPDALLVVMGKVREDPLRVSSVEFL